MSETVLDISQVFKLIQDKSQKLTVQQYEYAWDSFVRAIVSNPEHSKSLLLFDCFLIESVQRQNCQTYRWVPTSQLQKCCKLAVTGQVLPEVHLSRLFSKQKYSRFLRDSQLETLRLSHQTAWFALQQIILTIRQIMEINSSCQISICPFGTLKMQSKFFTHIYKDENKVRVRKLMTPCYKDSRILNAVQHNHLSQQHKIMSQNSQNKSVDQGSHSHITRKIQQKVSPLKEVQSLTNGWLGQDSRKHVWANRLVVPDVRISDDLLGAGIDPLKFDYNYSKLVQSSNKLFSKTFLKPKPAKTRHPGIIDKFERTNGVPQTGLKVSNSVLVRIGANYNHLAKSIYIDPTKKCIMYVPRQARMSLINKSKACLGSASSEEEYQFLTGHREQLKAKVELRRKTYQRYMKYIDSYIQNSNVSPLSKSSISRIVAQVNANKAIHDNISLLNQTVNEANQMYYKAYKKSVLDYILKDSRERQRIGIDITFRQSAEWGSLKAKAVPIVGHKDDKEKICKFLSHNLYYPQCLLEITEVNLKIREIEFFQIRNHSNKPVNLLYFIKKQRNHVNQVISYLGQEWVKNVAEVINKYVCVEEHEQPHLNTFIKLINVLLSNALKNVITASLEKLTEFFRKFRNGTDSNQAPFLQISIIDENGHFQFSDDFRKIMREEIRSLVQNIVSQANKIQSIEFYLKDEPNSYLKAYPQHEQAYEQPLQEILEIVEENCLATDSIKTSLKPYEAILSFAEATTDWLKGSHSLQEMVGKFEETQRLQQSIEGIPSCLCSRMFLVECFEEKERLQNLLDKLKSLIYQSIQKIVRESNEASILRIAEMKQKISANIEDSSDYSRTSADIGWVKKQAMALNLRELQDNKARLMKLHEIGYGYVSFDFMLKVYQTIAAHHGLYSELQFHENRLQDQKVRLEKKLKEKIVQFQDSTHKQYAAIKHRTAEFELRRIYNDYLIELNGFKATVEENSSVIRRLNQQERDLKSLQTQFKAAEDLKNLVMPLFELWSLVAQFDGHLREWKNQQISKMDVPYVKTSIQSILSRLSRVKLDQFSSLKISAELQADAVEILKKNISIMQIFSHAGLKDRHWQIFNNKLHIPGINLKQITYSKIKLLHEHTSDLEVLSAVSKQAIREYKLEKERADQQQFWSQVTFSTYTSRLDNSFCVSLQFLARCRQDLEDHSNTLLVMKNCMYSKMLYEQLAEWEAWLTDSQKIVANLIDIQSFLFSIGGIIRGEGNAKKTLPIELSDFEALESGWKLILKKIWEHSKFMDFRKNPKILEVTEDLAKKIEGLSKGVSQLLMLRRAEFPRFYFLTHQQLLDLLSKSAYKATKEQGLQQSFQSCFTSNLDLVYNSDHLLRITSKHDNLPFTANAYQSRSTKTLCETLHLVEKCMRTSLNQQIYSVLANNIEMLYSEDIIEQFSLPAIFCASNLSFSREIKCKSDSSKWGSSQNEKLQTISALKSILNSSPDLQVKLCKIIVSLMGQIEVVSKFMKIENFSSEHYEYQTQILFEQSEAIPDPNSIDSGITIHIFDQSMAYKSQYWGDQCDNYYSWLSPKYLLNLFYNNNSYCINLVSGCSLNVADILMSKICGSYYQSIQNPWFGHKDGIACILRGIVSAGVWVNIQSSLVQTDLIERMNNLFEQLNMKSKTRKQSAQAIYLSSLGLTIPINNNFNVFLSMATQNSIQQFPQSYRTRTRSLALCVPGVFSPEQQQTLNSVTSIYRGQYPRFLILSRLTAQFHSIHLTSQKLSQISNCLSSKKMCHKIWQQYISQSYLQQNQVEVKRLYDSMNLFANNSDEQDSQISEQQIDDIRTSQFTGLLSNPKQSMHAFTQKYTDMIADNYLNSKQTTHKYMLVYGSVNKKDIITNAIKLYRDYDEIDSGLYGFPVSVLRRDWEKYFVGVVADLARQLLKNRRSRRTDQNREMNHLKLLLWIQCENGLDEHDYRMIEQIVVGIEQDGISVYENSKKYPVIIRVLYECYNINSISPMTCYEADKINIEPTDNIMIGEYMSVYYRQLESSNKLTNGRINLETVTSELKFLQTSYEKILNMATKCISAKTYRSAVNTKLMLTRNMVNLLFILMQENNSKEVEDCCELQTTTFVKNCFIYCVYWTLCMGYLDSNEHMALEEYILKEHFPEVTEIQCISKYLLSEGNQWIPWSSLREEFGLNMSKNLNTYNLWVSTEENMRVYMNMIKMAEQQLPLALIGHRCSGKSTLLKQLSSFRIRPQSLLLDCHRKTKLTHVMSSLKNQIYYSRNPGRLILIDDIFLPEQESSISQLIHKMVFHNKLVFTTDHSKVTNLNICNVSSIFTCSPEQQDNTSFGMLVSQSQKICLSSISDGEVETIYRAHINFELNKLDIKDLLDGIEENCLGYLLKVSDKFGFTMHESHKIVQLMISRLNVLNSQRIEQEFQIDKNFYSEMWVMYIMLMAEHKPNFPSIHKFCFEEAHRNLNMHRHEDKQQFGIRVCRHLYSDLPVALAEYPNIGGKSLSTSDLSLEISQKIQAMLLDKQQFVFVSTQTSVRLILQLTHIFKVSPSHLLLVANGSLGARTLIRIVSLLLGVVFNEIETENSQNFTTDCVNIIKAGGKIDESLYFIDKKQLHKMPEDSEIMCIINEFISSQELTQFFTEERVQQIFVKFTKGKKLLKRSELVKKVRQKINMLFHFAISIGPQQLAHFKLHYPNLVNTSFIVHIDEYPCEAILTMGRKIIDFRFVQMSSQMREKVISAMTEIYQQFLKMTKRTNRAIQRRFKENKVIEYFRIFEIFYKRLEAAYKRQSLQIRIWEGKKQEMEQQRQALANPRHSSVLSESTSKVSILQSVLQVRESQQPVSHSTTNNYNDLCRVISQIESIIEISQNLSNTKSKQTTPQQLTPFDQSIGNVIMATSILEFGFYLSDSELLELLENSQLILQERGWKMITNLTSFNMLLTQQQNFRFEQLVSWQCPNNLINHIAMTNNFCTVVCLQHEEKVLDFYNFVKQMNGDNKVKLLHNKQLHQLLSNLSTGMLNLLINPSVEIIQKLKPLISNESEVRNEKLVFNLDEEVTLHKETRVLFVLTEDYIDAKWNIEDTFSQLWMIRFRSHQCILTQSGSQQTPCQISYHKKRGMIKLLRTSTSFKPHLIDEYLSACRQVSKIDNHIQNTVANIYKYFNSSDAIISKMQKIYEDRAALLNRMAEIRRQFDAWNDRQECMHGSAKVIDNLIQKFCSSKISEFQMQQLLKLLRDTLSKHTKSLRSNQQQQFCKLEQNGDNSSANQESMPTHILLKDVEGMVEAYCDIFQYRNRFLDDDRLDSNKQAIIDKFMGIYQTNKSLGQSEKQLSQTVKWKKLLSYVYRDLSSTNPKRPLKLVSDVFLVVKTSDLWMMSQFLMHSLTALPQHTEQVEIDMLTASFSPSLANKIFIVPVKRSEDWVRIMAFIKQQNDKKNAFQLLVICSDHLSVPCDFQLRSCIIESTGEIADLTDSICCDQALTGSAQLLSLVQSCNGSWSCTIHNLLRMAQAGKQSPRIGPMRDLL